MSHYYPTREWGFDNYGNPRAERELASPADQSLTPLDCGFDPRVHGMVCALRRGESVKYEVNGEIRVARGTDDEIARELEAAGYTIEFD